MVRVLVSMLGADLVNASWIVLAWAVLTGSSFVLPSPNDLLADGVDAAWAADSRQLVGPFVVVLTIMYGFFHTVARRGVFGFQCLIALFCALFLCIASVVGFY